MKNSIAFIVTAATLGFAFSAHAVQATGTSIGAVIKPSTPVVVRVIKPTEVAPGSTPGAGVTGPKVKPMADVRHAPPAKIGR